jgi:transposase
MSQNDFKTSEIIEPQEARLMRKEMSVLGLDIAKRGFHAVGRDDPGKIVLRTRLSRPALLPFIAPLPPVQSGMAAGGGAHYWASRCREHGHDVQLMAPQLVKP